jgi:hypothetical protein
MEAALWNMRKMPRVLLFLELAQDEEPVNLPEQAVEQRGRLARQHIVAPQNMEFGRPDRCKAGQEPRADKDVAAINLAKERKIGEVEIFNLRGGLREVFVLACAATLRLRRWIS